MDLEESRIRALNPFFRKVFKVLKYRGTQKKQSILPWQTDLLWFVMKFKFQNVDPDLPVFKM